MVSYADVDCMCVMDVLVRYFEFSGVSGHNFNGAHVTVLDGLMNLV